MDFGIPGEAIGKALGGILGQKKGNEKNIKKQQVELVASAGGADQLGGIFGRETGTKGPTRPFTHPLGMGGRIEPAGPEPPPAHSLGRVGEDAMGRSGQVGFCFFY